jgi:CRISPR-associated protein Csm1
MVDPTAKISSSAIALQVLQSGLTVLAQWAEANILYSSPVVNSIVEQTKSLLMWDNSTQDFYPLEQLFSQISLFDQIKSHESLYWPVTSLANRNPAIPFPVANPQDLDNFKQDICNAFQQVNSQEDWNNSTLLSLFLEKYTSHLSLGGGNIAFCDLVKMTAAVASAIASSTDLRQICLIAGDLSGIQKFIYTIIAILNRT